MERFPLPGPAPVAETLEGLASAAVRVLVASTSGAGHFGPLVPFAEALSERGDEVLRLVGEPPESELWEAFPRLSREAQAIFANREWFGRICTAAMRPSLERACDTFQPDLIVREPCEFASAIAARERGIGCVTVACSPAEVEWSALDLIAPVLPEGVAESLRASPYLTRFPESLDPSPFPDTRRYREAAPPAGDGTLIYATFGSVAAGIGFDPYRALLDAVGGLDVQVLLTTGADLELGPVPENVRVERWVPQAEALAQASLVVCHGGSGTVLGALAANLPLRDHAALRRPVRQRANARGRGCRGRRRAGGIAGRDPLPAPTAGADRARDPLRAAAARRAPPSIGTLISRSCRFRGGTSASGMMLR
jgi:hypothetical protein